jgi:GMP synthase (glutamine-hydrolysing)
MPPDVHSDRILILDFGAQYTQLIARRLREHQVYCEIHPHSWDLESIRAWQPRGIVLSGGPSSVLSAGAPSVDPGIYQLGVPVLGICYGLQLLCHQLGGLVEKAEEREYGRALLKLEREQPPDPDLPGGADRSAWMSHGDRVLRLPPGF